MIKLVKNIFKFREYLFFSIKFKLKAEIFNKKLGAFWWILDPLFQMLIYSFVFGMVYKSKEASFPIFLFTVLLPWKWTSSSIQSAIASIKGKKSIVLNLYVPKIIFPLENVIVNFVKYLFGILVLILMMIIFKIQFTFHFLEVGYVILVNFFFICFICIFISHMGLYILDIKNLTNHFTKLWWYISPGIYSLDMVPESLRKLIFLNPLTSLFISYRNTILYGKSPLYKELTILLVCSILGICLGMMLHSKYDKKYTKFI